MRSFLPQDQPDWEYQSVGNINMEFWMSPNPVDMFKTADFFDIVGNVWQHTITPTYPYDKFVIHPVYEDFSTVSFDDRHDLLKGGSFLATGNMGSYHTRQPFRRHFHQFAGFRYIETGLVIETDTHSMAVISDRDVEMNLKHHYLNEQSYVVEVVRGIREAVGLQQGRALTVGCSVGRIPLELGRLFEESIGIDYTTRYFQMSTRLKETGFLRFKDIDIDLSNLDLKAENNVSLLQMNPENPDEHKIRDFDLVVVDGYSIKRGALREVLTKVVCLARDSARVAVLSVSGVNEISKEEASELMAELTGGHVEAGSETILKASSQDQSYLTHCSEQL